MKKILSIVSILSLSCSLFAYEEGQDMTFKDIFLPDQVVEVLNTDTESSCFIRGGTHFKFLEALEDNKHAIFIINENFKIKNTDCLNNTYFIAQEDLVEPYTGANHFKAREKEYFDEIKKNRNKEIIKASEQTNLKLLEQKTNIFNDNRDKIRKYVKSFR